MTSRRRSPPPQLVNFSRYTDVRMTPRVEEESDPLEEALEKQKDVDAHDRGLIVERLAWTPEQRLEANAAFIRFYLEIRPEGPVIREE